ncbi:hypothetical protein DPMN_179164 [Dreissena polymorpha]|uniref:Uncharacterized protein n=1 Tax=Dreissena polymorpha TaxID=45954 RepID=A0A9D4EFJ6_DREPO|nr:hypothetical protein DPMN_179164 [Dreissena polymorpha]
MGGPEQDVAPSFTTIDVNGETVEGFDPFNRAGGITQLTPDQTDMALHMKPYDAVVSVNITYDDNTIQTESSKEWQEGSNYYGHNKEVSRRPSNQIGSDHRSVMRRAINNSKHHNAL